ncbi:CPCC family cysteine-rich protein [Paenibacillus sp. UNC451MF]
MKYTCPCCDYKTLDLKPPGTFYICPVENKLK